MTQTRDQDRDTARLVREPQPPVHPELVGDRCEGGCDLLAGEIQAVQFELHPLDEDQGLPVGVLIGVDDVSAVSHDEIRDRGDETLPIGAGEQQDSCRSGVLHG